MVGSLARPLEAMGNPAEHIHRCPYCELAFVYHIEVVDHVRHDHPEHGDVVAGIEPRELPAD